MLAVPTDVLQLVLMLLLRAKRAVMGSQPDEDAVQRITITTGRRDGTLVLTVEDSGRRPDDPPAAAAQLGGTLHEEGSHGRWIDGDGGAARRHLSSPAGNAHRPGGGAPRPGRSGASYPAPPQSGGAGQVRSDNGLALEHSPLREHHVPDGHEQTDDEYHAEEDDHLEPQLHVGLRHHETVAKTRST